jgi:hypothetical protein
MGERPLHSIPVKKFHYGADENFDKWILQFEKACIASNHPMDETASKRLFLEWLPLK